VKAVIMAGGQGTRLAPYTTVLPKPLMPLSDRPIVDVLLRQLVAAGIEEISISVGHLGSLIESWIRSEADYGVPIHFVYEDQPLGTAGSLRRIGSLDEPFLAMNGDILTTLVLGDLAAHRAERGAIAAMAVKERTVPVEYGVVHADGHGNVERLEEKPTLRYTVSMGVYAFDPRILELIEPDERIDFPDVLGRALDSGETVATYPFDGYWRDIGNHDDYEAAITEFSAAPERFIGATAPPAARATTPSSARTDHGRQAP
jgi:NDP-sugar pyrophosphorylase family protein